MQDQTIEFSWWQRFRVPVILGGLITLIVILGVGIGLKTMVAFYHYGRGYDWNQRQEYDKAIVEFTEAIRFFPRYVYAYHGRGFAWNEKKEYDKAVADYTKAIQIDPNYLPAYMNRAVIRESTREYDKAIPDYTEVIRLDRQNVSAYSSRGYAWSMKNECDKAIADFSEVIRLDPKNGHAYHSRGLAWHSKREYDKAIADYTAAIGLDPKNAPVLCNRAWIWATSPIARVRDGRRAVGSARTACELTGWKEAAMLETLAAANAEAGDFESALKWQTRANGLCPDNGSKTKGELLVKLYQEKKPYRD